MNKTAAFIMPLKLNGSELELSLFKTAVESIKNQTDKDWILVLVDDYSNNKVVYDYVDKIKEDLKEKIHVIYSEKNNGPGVSRNIGISYAHEIGAPFVVFLDSDDVSDPRRLELVRKAFEDETVNVVYTSFDVIDENGNIVPDDKINMSVREIIDGHKVDIVEGENAWIQITMKKKYTNLTSCTAVRTSLAYEEKFPQAYVSEDCHTWMRYGAHPGKFVFLRDIKGGYRICSGTSSRSRSENVDFYGKMMQMDSAGFEAALELAKKYGTMGGYDEYELRTAFYVRLALGLIHGGSEQYCKIMLEKAMAISKENTLKYLDLLYCEPQYKTKMKEMVL